MSKKSWIGLLIVLAGFLLGVIVAGGMYKITAAEQAQAPHSPVGALPAPAPITLDAVAGDEINGRKAYDHACAGCHGDMGKSDTPLHGPLINVYYPTDGVLAAIIRNGYGTMPATDERHLSDQEVADVIAYIRTFP